MFNLAIDSKLRGCDLVNLHVRDVTHGNQILLRAMVIQRKTQRPVQFEMTEPTRGGGRCMDRQGSSAGRSVLIPKSGLRVASRLDAPVCSDGASVGRGRRAGLVCLRDAFDAAYQGNADL